MKKLTVLATLLFAAASARAATDIDISAYYNGTWSGSVPGTAIPTSGNTGSGLTFGDWKGRDVGAGPDIGTAQSVTLNLTPTALSVQPSVNALFNTLYGVTGTVNATITFKNNLGATASFSLVGNQTVRDYNTNTYTNDLQGYNTNATYGAVTTQNWWNNSASGGGQRLDASTFVLPTSWAGSNLTSITLYDPYTSAGTDDICLSALQVSSVVPEPSTWAAVAASAGLLGVALLRRRAAARA